MATSAGSKTGFVRQTMEAARPAPITEVGLVGWMKKNLFSSVPNTVLTLVAIYIVWVTVPPLLEFSIFNAVWSGDNRAACTNAEQGGLQPEGWFGACWPYVGAYFKQFIYGRYPAAEYWRVNIVYFMFVAGLVPLLIPSLPYKRENALFMFLIFPVVTFILLTGGHIRLEGFLLPEAVMRPSFVKFLVDFGLLTALAVAIGYVIARGTESNPAPMIRNILFAMGGLLVIALLCAVNFGLRHVETDVWGGLLVTLVIAVTGIVASLPLGILLALGRRSQMPVIRLFSVIFIEFWRGIPLITVLFMSSVMLPLFLPEGVTFDKLLRALIGVALFSAAYMAEVVRGGIQALPKGQYEGAMALGLSYWQMMQMIILPQALKLVIPGIVNSFIALFKDTTLVLIIGLFDFLGQIQSSYSDSSWASPVQSLTGYFFAALVYWLFCFSMSRYSIFMERRLDTGHR
ncbi:MAG: amino acid ABC transporter permease [Nitratireductor sp.]|nr:amino acid ABC transporter permease [Nitratireductor sp.]